MDIIVSSGFGFTLLSSRLGDFYKTSVLSYVPIEGTHVTHTYQLVWERDNTNPVLEKFISAAKEADERDRQAAEPEKP